MLKKRYVKSRNTCKVTFEIPKDELPNEISPEAVCLVGDFNDWDTEATPMSWVKSTKAFKAVLDLEPETSYEFRYLLDGDRWYNDSEASAYVPNGFGAHNSVVETTIA